MSAQLRLFSLMAGILAVSLPAAAQPRPAADQGSAELLSKVSPEQMAEILTKAGYASQVQGSGAQKTLSTQFFPGAPGKVIFSMCDDAGCSMVGFIYDFGKLADIDAKWVNAWNDAKSVSAVLQDDGRLQMLMWTHLFGPVTPEHLVAAARRFVEVVNSSSDFQPSN